MSKREDIKTLCRWALQRRRRNNGEEPGSPWIGEETMRLAAYRVFIGDGDPLIKFAGSDLAELRRDLAEVPMTTAQREGVNWRLDKLQSAMETETPDEGGCGAVRAIEKLSGYLGGIDELWHNYHIAATIGKDACKAMMRIRAACPTYDASKGAWTDAADRAIAALGSVKRHGDIIKVAEGWQADSADDEREEQTAARQAILEMMKAIARALPAGSELRCACCELAETLDTMLGNDIPF